MKIKPTRIFLPLIIFLCIIGNLVHPVAAKEYCFHSSELGTSTAQESWNTLTESLPKEIQTELHDFSLEDLSSAADLLREKSNIWYWIQQILHYFTSLLPDMIDLAAPLISLMIIIAAIQLFIPSSVSPAMQKAFMTYTGLVTALMLYRPMCDTLNLTEICLNQLCSIMNLLTPIMETIFLSAGSLTQLSVSTQAIMLFITATGNFTAYLLTPLTTLLFTLSTVFSICDEAKMNHLTGTLRKLIMRLLQLITIFFSFMLSTQSILAKSADSLGMKTARFAIGSFIPIAGGILAETLSTLREGFSLLKNAAGIGGILVMLLLLLPDILRLFLTRFTLYLIGTAADLLRLDKFSSLANELHGILEILIGLVLFTAIMFILILILFTQAQVTA